MTDVFHKLEPERPVTISPYFDMPDEYVNTPIYGGKWFYSQNKPGTSWVDKASNIKGWTVDFELQVMDIENSDTLSIMERPDGVGLYVNDGTKYEHVYFLKQEIIFANADKIFSVDTTSNAKYRLIGKEGWMKLFMKRDADTSFSTVGEISLATPASSQLNGYRPATFQDTDGKLHMVWSGDGNKGGQLYYSVMTNSQASTPELIVQNSQGILNPDIAVSSDGKIYIVYETKETAESGIGFVYKTSLGWSVPQIVAMDAKSKRPRVAIDVQGNVVVVWEDYRFGQPDIFVKAWDKSILRWGSEVRLSYSTTGSINPSVSQYLDYIFIAWTERFTTGRSGIRIMSYHIPSGRLSATISVTDADAQLFPNFPDVLVNVAGKVFVVWQNNIMGRFEIQGRVFSTNLFAITDVLTLTYSHGCARYPVLSESVTGNVHVVWQDSLTDISYIPDLNILDAYFNPYRDDIFGSVKKGLWVAYYDNVSATFFSSGQGSFDVQLIFDDDRSAFLPGVSPSFSEEMPILYESLMAKDDSVLGGIALCNQVRYASYDLTRSSETYLVENVLSEPYNPYTSKWRDQLINNGRLRKEIAFGDFSSVLNTWSIFKNFGFYTEDAVDPLTITEVSYVSTDNAPIAVNDIALNNYSDSWLVGNCGFSFYSASSNTIYDMSSTWKTLFGTTTTGLFRTLAFDANNWLFIGGYTVTGTTKTSRILYSLNHTDTYKELSVAGATGVAGEITALCFDRMNRLFVGTSTAGAYYVTLTETNGTLYPGTPVSISSPSTFITSIKTDANNVTWIGTRNGLVRFYNGPANGTSVKDTAITFQVKDGLASNYVNDIAIRNSAIRYVATSNGISKMVGSAFEYIKAIGGDIYNNNVKSIAWRDPNVLWAGTLSVINQLTVDDQNGTYTTLLYHPDDYSSFADSYDGFVVYYIVPDSPLTAVPTGAVIEVYLNGHRISYGFQSILLPVPIIRFETKLQPTDVVDVVVRTDVTLLSSFAQGVEEKKAVGERIIRISDVGAENGSIYISTEGDENEVKINEEGIPLPFDKIFLDTTAPTGTIDIAEQISRSIVKINITADDDGGSGVGEMVVSSFENFTIDGVTAQTPQAFQNSINYDLGLTLNSAIKTMTLIPGVDGTGSHISMFAGTSYKDMFVGVSNPASVHKYDFVLSAWENLLTFGTQGTDRYVDFVVRYGNYLVVGLGHDSEAGLVYSYPYLYDDQGVFQSFGSPTVLSVDENRFYCTEVVSGYLYIGTGTTLLTGQGRIYKFDGQSLSIAMSGMDRRVYSLTAHNTYMLAATGQSGKIYQVNLEDQSAFILHTDVDPEVTAIKKFKFGTTDYFYAGTGTSAEILRSSVSSVSFDLSFKTVTGRVQFIKSFGTGTDETLYMAIDQALYYLSSGGTWSWKYSHTESIRDMTFDTETSNIYIVSDTGVTRVEPLTQSKQVFLKLIDRAGNETNLYDDDGEIKPELTDSIEISSLAGFVNENRLIELDEFGNIVDVINGEGSFYSGTKVEAEIGVYESEVFDGTQDLVQWQALQWEATQYDNTLVQMYVRSSNSSTDILLAPWIGPYGIEDSANLDISFITGRYIQFKVLLTSKVKDVSPIFNRALIKAVTTEAIHFFTTNFALPSAPTKGILTSQSLIPVAADVVFGINTTNSVDWNDYQVIDENRVFNVNQTGSNIRIGIKFITPTRSSYEAPAYDEYDPYFGFRIYLNTIDFGFSNTSGTDRNYHFRVTLFSDFEMTEQVYQVYSLVNPEGFSVDSDALTTGGVLIANGTSVIGLFTVPASAGVQCGTEYYAKVEAVYTDGVTETSQTIVTESGFIGSCNVSFVDTIRFTMNNNTASSQTYGMRIKFYTDPERTRDAEYRVVYSGTDNTGWTADDATLATTGVTIPAGGHSHIKYAPDLLDFTAQTTYFLSISAWDGSQWVDVSDGYTFQVRDIESVIYCGDYYDVPIVKNFAIMFELANNEFVTLNLV